MNAGLLQMNTSFSFFLGFCEKFKNSKLLIVDNFSYFKFVIPAVAVANRNDYVPQTPPWTKCL